MAQGPTNVNLIATYIHNNPGCRRVDLKRMLHKAATGKHTDKQHHLACKNQYFQRYGATGASNVYLDRLWYNQFDQNQKQVNRWGFRVSKNMVRKSSYQLTYDGKDKVWQRPMVRPFEEGSLVEWQWNSPNGKYGWREGIMKGLVVERTDLYGLWILGIGGCARPNGQLTHVSHQAFVRRYNDKT